jgi:hypothetical protein
MAKTISYVRKQSPIPLPETLPEGTQVTLTDAEPYVLRGTARLSRGRIEHGHVQGNRYYGDWRSKSGKPSTFFDERCIDWDLYRAASRDAGG